MAKLTIKFSEEALKVLEEYSKIKEMTPEQYIKSGVEYFEQWAACEEKKQKGFENAIRLKKKDKARKAYAKHKWHRYIMKKWKNGKYLEMEWHQCPIQDDPDEHRKEAIENIGKYYIEISQKTVYRGLITKVIKQKMYFFNTLRSLKKNVNSWFKRYGFGEYYTIKKKIRR
jgi:hypothetical protein